MHNEHPSAMRKHMTHQDTNAKEQWLICGLDVLEAQGHAAVKVEPMAAQLNVTKGSFYWHFENRQTFFQVALITAGE